MNTSEATSQSQTSGFQWRQLCDSTIGALKSIELPDDLQIPSLPAALNDFLDASADPNFDVRRLADIVEHDPGMTVDLLKCVNVASSGTRPVKTPFEALVRLGVPQARSYLMAAGIKGAMLAYESRLMNHRSFWNESVRRALFARECAANMGVDQNLAFISGLIQDFMLPVLTNQFDKEYIRFRAGSCSE
ncbi:MAG: HDOD domain-containing protein [Planctomycetaceae bacterium]